MLMKQHLLDYAEHKHACMYSVQQSFMEGVLILNKAENSRISQILVISIFMTLLQDNNC